MNPNKKILKEAEKLNQSIKAKTKYNEDVPTFTDNKARSSDELIKELTNNG